MPLDEVLRHRTVRTFFQPIVRLTDRKVLAYEALTRGPVGPLELPDRLFAIARTEDRLQELDDLCFSAAIANSLSAGMTASMTLFVNIEAEAGDLNRIERMLAELLPATGGMRVAIEVTERATSVPIRALVAGIDRLRAKGLVIALDDVGTEETIALMRALKPDIVKLDKDLVQAVGDPDKTLRAAEIRSFCLQSGTTLLAEGIETVAHLENARNIGAQLGQGWLFGRPSPRARRSTSFRSRHRSVVQPA